jgi:tetratricopeptide (TPR) repeat protein
MVMIKKRWLDISMIGIIAFVVHAPSLRFGFVNLDDNFYVTDNGYLRHISLSNIKYFFTSFHHGVYAPVQYLTYMLIYRVSDYHAMLYHLTGIVFYLLSGMMVYLLIDKIQGSRPVAFFSAMLFLLSPVNIDSAVWIAELKNPQSLCFFLASFYLYILFRERRKEQSPDFAGMPRAHKEYGHPGFAKPVSPLPGYSSLYVFSLLTFTLGLLVKPPGATVLIMMFVYDLIGKQGVRDSIKRLSPYILISIPFMIVYMIGQSTIGAYHGLIRGNVWSQIKTITSVAAGIFNYPLKTILPFNLSIAYPIDAKITGTVFALSIAVLLSLLAGIRALLKNNDKRPAFWLLWYFVNMLPYYGIIAMPFFANWYLYIPSIGIYALLVSSINSLNNRKFVYGVLALFLIVFGFLGFQRQFVWKNDITMWRSSLNAVGNDPYILRNLAISYFKNHENTEGILYGDILLQQTPDFVMMKYLIGKGYAGKQEYDRAQDILNSALDQLNALEEQGIAGTAVMPGLGDTPATLKAMLYVEMADIKLSLNQPEIALSLYTRAINTAPYVPAYDKLAYLYVKTNRINDARDILDKITVLKPDDPEPWRMLGYLTAEYYSDRKLAVIYFKKSLEIEPDQQHAAEMRKLIKAWESSNQ